MKNLSSVSKAEQSIFLQSFDTILCDVDGVLWLFNNQLIPGATDCIKSLKQLNKKIIYISNNSLKPPRDYFNQLKSFGFDVEKNELITPISAIISHLKSLNFSKQIYLIGMEAVRTELELAGFKIAEPDPDHVEENVPNFLRKCVVPNEQIGAVVADTDTNLNYLRLQRAAYFLKNPDVLFVAGGGNKKIMFEREKIVMGPGYFHDILEDVARRKAVKLCKPSPDLNEFVRKKCGIRDARRVLVIGDSIPDDMGFAANCGYQKLLVLSGVTDQKDLETMWTFPEEYRPYYYVDSLKGLYEILKDLWTSTSQD